MTRILVLYARTHGHTGKIAARTPAAIYDFTDWDDVARFGAECASLVAVATA